MSLNRRGEQLLKISTPKTFAYSARSASRKVGKDKTTEHYEKFLDLWKDADPGIAEVDDAKERLAGLR